MSLSRERYARLLRQIRAARISTSIFCIRHGAKLTVFCRIRKRHPSRLCTRIIDILDRYGYSDIVQGEKPLVVPLGGVPLCSHTFGPSWSPGWPGLEQVLSAVSGCVNIAEPIALKLPAPYLHPLIQWELVLGLTMEGGEMGGACQISGGDMVGSLWCFPQRCAMKVWRAGN